MNKVIITGNLTKDPETRTTQSGIVTCSFTVAVQRRFKNAQGTYDADFLPVVAWRQTAENCGRYLSKGRKVAVEGSIQTRSYEAKDGGKRYVTEIIADSVEFLSSGSPQGGRADAEDVAAQAAAVFGEEAVGYEDDNQLPF